MTYTMSSGTLNPSIPYYQSIVCIVLLMALSAFSAAWTRLNVYKLHYGVRRELSSKEFLTSSVRTRANVFY